MLVNNAGMMQEASVGGMSLEDWHRTLTVNLTTPFLMIKAALPYLRDTKGTIVNIGSIEALGSNPGHAVYCTSKAGLHGPTRPRSVATSPRSTRWPEQGGLKKLPRSSRLWRLGMRVSSPGRSLR